MEVDQVIQELQGVNRDANSNLLESSRQGALLCIGLLAASPLWADTSGGAPQSAILLAFIMLVCSALASVGVHFGVGYRSHLAVKKIYEAIFEGNSVPQIHFVIKEAWVAAGVQAATACVGMIAAIVSLACSV